MEHKNKKQLQEKMQKMRSVPEGNTSSVPDEEE